MHSSENNSAAAIAIEEVKDGTLVKVTGEIKDISDDEFTLEYGLDKTSVVELDRFGWTGEETQYLNVGESVTVSGLVDDDFLEGKEIEAYNLRLNDQFVYYYTSDKYPVYSYEQPEELPDGTYLSITGKIVNINAPEMTIENKNGKTIIDVANLDESPLDNKGDTKLKVGDRVYVYGDVDVEAWDEKEIVADVVIQLNKANSS